MIWVDLKGKKVESYYLYDPVPEEEDYVLLVAEHMVELTTFAEKCPYPFKILRSVRQKDKVLNLPAILSTIEEKTKVLQETVTTIQNLETVNFNPKCNVHVGGGMIATFNDISLLEDACSDSLQQEITKGWRIIACCVQPDQRRPDYVLGRYNDNIEGGRWGR